MSSWTGPFQSRDPRLVSAQKGEPIDVAEPAPELPALTVAEARRRLTALLVDDTPGIWGDVTDDTAWRTPGRVTEP
jgi:hypothetical protein